MSLLVLTGLPHAGDGSSPTPERRCARPAASRLEASYSGGNDEGGVNGIPTVFDEKGEKYSTCRGTS